MKHVEYYLADDGTEFDYESDCYQYELELKTKTLTNDLFFLNSHHDVLPLTSAGYEQAIYVCANTEEAAQYLDELAAAVGLSTPWRYREGPRPGRWIYVEGEARHFDWLDFGDLEDFYNTCETAFNSVP